MQKAAAKSSDVCSTEQVTEQVICQHQSLTTVTAQCATNSSTKHHANLQEALLAARSVAAKRTRNT